MNAAMATGPATAHTAYIGLGSNLSDPAGHVRAALAALDRIAATRLRKSSSLYRSAPVGYAEQPDFVNAVAQVETELGPQALLAELLALEQAHGRIREIPNGPRTLDLDLLLYDEATIREENLVVPHPRMHERGFVLVPMSEIAPDANVPGIGPVAQLLERIGPQGVQRLHG